MSERQHLSPSEWQVLIEEQIASGLTGVAFCNEHGLSAKTFYKSKRKHGFNNLLSPVECVNRYQERLGSV